VFPAAPVAVFISVGWSVMVDIWMGGSTAAAGGMFTGMLVPWEAVHSITGRMGS